MRHHDAGVLSFPWQARATYPAHVHRRAYASHDDWVFLPRNAQKLICSISPHFVHAFSAPHGQAADPNRAGRDGATALYWACWAALCWDHKLECVRLLLEFGADPNKATRGGNTGQQLRHIFFILGHLTRVCRLRAALDALYNSQPSAHDHRVLVGAFTPMFLRPIYGFLVLVLFLFFSIALRGPAWPSRYN